MFTTNLDRMIKNVKRKSEKAKRVFKKAYEELTTANNELVKEKQEAQRVMASLSTYVKTIDDTIVSNNNTKTHLSNILR